MILHVLVFASNFVFTWVIPIAYVCASTCACACACVASENQALLVTKLEINKGALTAITCICIP